MGKKEKFKVLDRKKIYIFLGISAFLVFIFVISLLGNNEDKLNPIAVYELNSQGDYVGDNFKIEYNDKNDIILMESEGIKEEFEYYYDEDGSVYRIDISSFNQNLSNTRVDITYYDNGEIFLLKLSNNENVKTHTEQYYLYNDADELKHIVQTTIYDGSVMTKYIIEFEYYTEDDVEYVIEKTYSAHTGEFTRGRIYTKNSTQEYTNTLEKLGITTHLMYAKGLNKLDYRSQNINLLEIPIGTIYYSSKVLSWYNNNSIITDVYDENGNYVYTKNVSTVRTLYKENNCYTREEISKYDTYLHRTYKYIMEDGYANRLEVYEREIDEKEYERLKEEFLNNNENIEYVNVSGKLLDYIGKSVKNIDVYYNSYLNTIKTNWNKYDKYKKPNNENSIENNISSDASSDNDNNTSNNSTTKPNNSTNNNGSSSNSSSNNANNNTNNNIDNKPVVELNLSVKERSVGKINVNVSTNLSDYRYNLYLNDVKVKDNLKLSIGTNDYSDTVTLDNIPIGKNVIKVELLKDGKIVKTKENNYIFELSKVPTPIFSISDGYNTYDSTYEITVWPKDNNCSGDDRCKEELYVNGVKQKYTSGSTVPLSMGDNIFKVELKNIFGKSSCKMVQIKRFEYDSNVSFTKLGKISISEC